MIVLKTVRDTKLAVHKDDIDVLVGKIGTVKGNYNIPYTEVYLKKGKGYNVLESVDEIFKLLKGE